MARLFFTGMDRFPNKRFWTVYERGVVEVLYTSEKEVYLSGRFGGTLPRQVDSNAT
jgi:hypothetical protein